MSELANVDVGHPSAPPVILPSYQSVGRVPSMPLGGGGGQVESVVQY